MNRENKKLALFIAFVVVMVLLNVIALIKFGKDKKAKQKYYTGIVIKESGFMQSGIIECKNGSSVKRFPFTNELYFKGDTVVFSYDFFGVYTRGFHEN